MIIGIFTLKSSAYTGENYYNKQDTGLGRALALFGNRVYVYNLITNGTKKDIENEITENLSILYHKVKKCGCFTFTDLEFLKREMEVLICFSDNQLLFPKVYRWCKANSVLCIPYIGVVKSHHKSKWFRILKDILSRQNIALYRKLRIFVKTPDMIEELKKLGVTNRELIPVGLDRSLLKQDKIDVSEREALKKSWGFQKEDRIILFVGRMEPEKRPMEMLDLFSEIYRNRKEYRLMMVGAGVLKQSVEKKINAMGLSQAVILLEQVPYQKMWQVYAISERMVNLNRQEIYGMAVLEAMYYGVLVYAIEAPGPKFILKHFHSGVLCREAAEILKYWDLGEELENKMKEHARKAVEKDFTWDVIAGKVQDRLGEWLNG